MAADNRWQEYDVDDVLTAGRSPPIQTILKAAALNAMIVLSA
jgi:hypothetical protein